MPEAFPIIDPTPHLAPTAKRILDAGVRVLDAQGPAGLTFENIAREAGENGALIRYHFGSKAGLIASLVDVVLYSQSARLIEILSPLPPGRKRLHALFARQLDVALNPVRFRQVFYLAPLLLNDPALTPKLRDVMRWYMAFDAWALGTDGAGQYLRQELGPLSTLTCAMIYGVALQSLADPELDVRPAFDLWEKLVTDYLGTLQSGEAAADS